MIYLCTPYWHIEEAIRDRRALEAKLITRALIRRGMPIFSPIVHGRALDFPDSQLPLTNTAWVDLDLNYVDRCQSVLAAQIDGWQQSVGMQREMAHCSERGIPIMFLSRSECDLLIKNERAISGLPAEKI